ncbi:unnamed protein product, partial [Phaeothamnion confervicola]
ETNKSDIAFSARGSLRQVNEYDIVRDLGHGATAEVKLCQRRTPLIAGSEPELFAVKIVDRGSLVKRTRANAFSRRPGRTPPPKRPAVGPAVVGCAGGNQTPSPAGGSDNGGGASSSPGGASPSPQQSPPRSGDANGHRNGCRNSHEKGGNR